MFLISEKNYRPILTIQPALPPSLKLLFAFLLWQQVKRNGGTKTILILRKKQFIATITI